MKFKLFALISALTMLLNFSSEAQWTQLTIPNSTASYRSAYFKNANEGFVAGAERIRHTLNGGATWDTISYGIYWAYLSGCIVENMHFVSATEGIASGWNFWDNCEIVFKTYDGGNTWDNIKWGNANAAFGTYLHDMTFVNSTSGICVGDLGHIITTNDAGDTWSYNNSGTSNNLYGVYFIGNTGWVVGDQIIMKTTNMGSTWSSQTFTGEYFQDVYFTSTNVGYAVGDHIYKTTDGGTTWNQIPTSYNLSCNDVWAVNADTIYIANSGNLLKSNDAGATWLQQPTAHDGQSYYGVWFLNPNFGIATAYDGNNGLVYKTTTGGDPVQQNDAGVSYIDYFSSTACQGLLPVQLQIKNYGQATLTSATINWKVNGVVQIPYTWNGNLSFDSTSALFTIGSANFPSGNDTVVAWTTTANGNSDYIHYNDTAKMTAGFYRLNGNYTIGGTNPNFATITAAVAQLNNYGTCGNVNFKIRNGTYTDAVTLSNFYKTNASDNVIFESESGDSTQVVWNGSGIKISLNTKCSNVTFSKITVGSSNDNSITMNDSVKNITVSNCILSASVYNIEHLGYACDNINITNNLFSSGTYGVAFAPTLVGITTNITIINNNFSGQNATPVYLKSVGNFIVDGNNITTNSSAGEALHIESCHNGFTVSNNKIISNYGYVMQVINCNDTLNAEGKFINNYFASVLNLGPPGAIQISNSYYMSFYNNSFNVDANAVIRMIYLDTLKQQKFDFVNNAVVNRHAAPVFKIENGLSSVNPSWYANLFKNISHNAYVNNTLNYTGANYFGFLETYGNVNDLNEWKNIFTTESSSVYADPQFASLTDFHIYPNTSNYKLNKAGIPVAGVTTDLEGDNRNITKPDIGADEFATSNLDAGALRFERPTSLCAGANDLYIRIINYGNSTLTSATLNYSVNGITQPTATWSGSLTTGDSTAFQLLGNYVFTNGNSYIIKAWTTNPNGGGDAVAINDTITATLTAKGLTGVYTIGGVAPSYTTITAAVADLNLNGVCGATTFNIRPGTYIEAVTINAISGASALNNITFQSENGDSSSVIIYHTANSPFTFDSASYIAIHQLTFGNGIAPNRGNLALKNNANHISFTHNAFSNAGFYTGVSNDVKNSSDILVDGNYFYQCVGAVIFSNASFTNLSHGNVLSNNVIELSAGAAIYINKANDISIFNNKITGAFGSSNSVAMIDVRNCTGKAIIQSNQIIFKNNLFGIGFTNNTGHFYDKSLIANNMVSMKGNYSYSCFLFQNSKYVQCSYNTGLLDSTNMSYNNVFYGGTYMDVSNNCFYNKAGGYVMDGIAGATNINSDYNNLYTTGSLYFEANVSPNNLQGWQALTGQELHSLNVVPSFVSYNDLHLLNDYNLDASATYIANVTTDADGNARNLTTPDIGADEVTITPIANDAGVRTVVNPGLVCSGNNLVQVVLKNYGNNNLTSATIQWTINGVAQANYSWSGNLSSISLSSPITIGSYNFNAPDSFNIVAWTSNPNGTADNISLNDSATLKEFRTRLNGSYTLGGSNPDYASFDDAFAALKSYGVCGPVIFNIRNGIYNGPQNVINSITGASLINTITFQSESSDSTVVTINNGAFGSSTFNLNGADFFIFKQLTINGGGSSYYPITLDNGCDYNTVSNCVINGLVYVYLKCNHNLIANNIVNAEILITGTTVTSGYGNTISGNTIINDNGIVCQFEDSLLIEKNIIINPLPYITGGNYGINLLAYNSHFKCIKNRISGNFSAGINLTQDGTISDTAIVANNIVVGGNVGGSGIYISCQYVKVVYNTFFIPSTSSAYPCENLAVTYNYGVVVKNNQFITQGYGWAYYWGQLGGSVYVVSDYNNYSTAGPDLISVGLSPQYQSIAGFNAAHPTYDANSTDVDPQFPNASFLYPANPAAQGTGIPIAGVTDDINDSLRSTTNPNMGAMEVPPVVVHDSINKDIAVKLLNDTVTIGNNIISVQVNNNRPFTADSALHIYEGVIDTLYFSYSVNGAAPVNETWTGSLALYDSITFNFAAAYNVPKGKLYHVHIEVQMPNKFTVINYSNDTLTKDLGTKMIGIYTVGGFNPDFVNLDEAYTSLYNIHAAGAVTFSIRPGVDSLFSIYQYQDFMPVTFESETGNAADVTIKISVVFDSYHINFKNVTLNCLTNTGALYNYKGAEFIGGYFTIDSCIIEGLNSDPLYANGLTFVHSDYVSVTNCHFKNLDNGVNFSDNPWFGSNYFYDGSIVVNNVFDSVQNCIHVLGTMADTVLISGNTMNQPAIGVDFNPASFCDWFIMEKNIVVSASVKSFQAGNAFGGSVYSFNVNNNMLGGYVQIQYFAYDTLYFNYNSVYGPMEIQDCAYLHMRNNSIYSAGTNRAFMFFQSNPVTSIYDCDYNNYYSPNATELAFISIYNVGTITAQTIADITSLTGAENNSVSVNPMYVSTTDLHSNSPVLNNAGTPLANITTDIDDELRSVTTPDIGCDEFGINDSLVWPGDCNYDGVANNYDLLSIGLYFNQTGTVRASASNTWIGQASANWGTLQYCGWDKKHADCNGDGIISWSDTTAIKLNWGQTHPFKAFSLTYINTQPDLHFVSSASAYKPGDTVDVEIWSGDAANPVAALYGISFDVAFPANMVKAGSMTLTFNPSWLGIENVTAITTSNITTTAAGSISRITGTDTSGYGMFAKLHFIVEPTLTSVTNFNLSFSNYLAVTANGNMVQFNTVSDTLTIDPSLSIEENASQHFFTLYPNPTTDETVITYNLQSSSQIKIELYNSIGERINVLKDEKQQGGNHQQKIKLNTNKFSKGIYFVKMMVDGNVYARKLVVE
ncbi:MAG: T9SS type A sorting domain-containing protein [Bacteroidia bacterium]